MKTNSNTILTPDQRLRVFVSSTLQELLDERKAVKDAIESIHLTPVMFELGARPHAPRNLYRQYLAQSHIFVGIYWDSYGWVSPEETISGLEDEYNLSGDRPKLIYIKQSAGTRDERLKTMLKKIQTDDKVSYKSFQTAEELKDLVINDLAILLTERFNQAQEVFSDEEFHYEKIENIPSIPNSLIGREEAIKDIADILSGKETRLLTLFGPGGIGKSRLALEVAKRVKSSYSDGVVFVPLAPIRDHNLVLETICSYLGLKVTGNFLESLKVYFQKKSFLLILDNFEQVVEAAGLLDDILFEAPGLQIVVTSRERLGLSFERTYVVSTLPCTQTSNSLASGNEPPAVTLFIERARALQPGFAINDQNKQAIELIACLLEGLPLAIELAAGQINLYNPNMLLDKLRQSIHVLKTNYRDIPERQRTMYNTIEWSYNLLSPAEQNMLLHLCVFTSGCTIEAVESVMKESNADVYDILGSLIDKSLITKQEVGTRIRFQMLKFIREYLIDILKSKGEYEQMKQKQADFYHHCLLEIKLLHNKIDQKDLLNCLEMEHNNLREVMEFLLDKKELTKLTQLAWSLWLFWWVNAHTREGYSWVKSAWEIYNSDPAEFDEATHCQLATNTGTMAFLQRDIKLFKESLAVNYPRIRQQPDHELVAVASLIMGVVKTVVKEHEEAEVYLQIALDRYKRIGLTTGISFTLTALGRNCVYGNKDLGLARDYYNQAVMMSRKEGNTISEIIALSGAALTEVMDPKGAPLNFLEEVMKLSTAVHFYEAMAWSVEIWSLMSMVQGKYKHAVTLLSGVTSIRETMHLPVWEDLHQVMKDAESKLKSILSVDEFKKAWDQGTCMNLESLMYFAQRNELVERKPRLISV